ncbi:DUF1295 domain-containing protein [Candidatus Bipolaricaulota bacterium]|nr:DUF1295 domain-containing protein [Candidatus Bipolaricaulota bacterium]
MFIQGPIAIVVAVFFYMTLVYLIAQIKSDYSVVDVAWGPGFVLVGVLSVIISPGLTIRGLVAATLVGIWGLRLGYHILQRNWGKPEDFRYQEMREDWEGRAYLISYVRIFLVQGLLLLVISYPLILINFLPKDGVRPLDYLGILVWLIGFGVEVIGDYQLSNFIKNRKSEENRIMTEGLWKYTRHPNYFGEALLWWGIYLLTVSVPYGWAGVVSPIAIGYLLLFVSGVPPLEKRYEEDEEYQEYAERTNKFFPWFPEDKT